MNAHLKKHKMSPFKCTKCQAVFIMQNDLKKHEENAHQTIQPFQCTKCNLQLGSKYDLNVHFKKEHKYPNKCLECQAMFQLEDYLIKHKQSIHRTNKTYQCKHCDMKYKEEKDLNLHLKEAHKNNQHFKCEQCKAFFVSNKNLQEHITKIHMIVNVKCWTCGRSFKSKHTLQSHIQDEHRNKPRYLYDNTHNRYQCSYNKQNVSSGPGDNQQYGTQGGPYSVSGHWQTVGGRRRSHVQGRWQGQPNYTHRYNYQTPIYNNPLHSSGFGE